MQEKIPRTPLSTPLSGSAKETEIRLRNIFSGPKKRPPIPLMILVAAVCVFCGNIVSCQVKEPEGPEAEVWVDYFDAEEMPWDGSAEIQLEEYPGVTFRWVASGVTARDETGETTLLIYGMPVWNVFLCDLNGDGRRELCTTAYFGSGIVDSHIEVYDYAAKQWYILWGREEYDYALSLEDGQLRVSQWEYQGGPPCQGEPLSTGGLALSSDSTREGEWFVAQPAVPFWSDAPRPLGEDLRREAEARLASMGDGAIARLLRQDMDQAMEPDTFQSNEFWTWTDSVTVSLCALAGPAQQDYVLVELYSSTGPTLEYALYSPELWAYILQHYHTDWEVDQEMLPRIQSRLDALIQQRCRETAERGPGYEVTGGDVTALKRLYTYDDLDFSPGTAYLYDLRIALTGADLTQIHMAGGEWVDDLGRLRDDYLVAYAAILEEDGEIVKVVFLAGDAVSVWGYSEEGTDEFRLATEEVLRTREDGERC